jgi:hypothetical protein
VVSVDAPLVGEGADDVHSVVPGRVDHCLVPGISKPKWVGGFAAEKEAKAARDEGRVKARHGEYIDRNRISVTEYLDDWIDAHATEIKPRTLADYRACIRLYVTLRIGQMPIQLYGHPQLPSGTVIC